MSPEMARRVEDYRWENRIASESEALRRLVLAGLNIAERAALSGKEKADG
jgi:hypothetical protein